MIGLRTALRAATDQLRTETARPLAILSGIATPCVFAYIVHSYRGGPTDVELAVGIAGLGFLDALVILIVLGILNEKRCKTLQPALSSPAGIAPVILGRIAGMGTQSLLAIPGTFVFLAGMWGLAPGFDWRRMIAGVLLLAVSTTAVMGLLSFILLRYPFSPGMTNALVGMAVSLGGLLARKESLPPLLRWPASLFPQSHIMAWVRGGGYENLATAGLLASAALALLLYSVRLLERSIRRKALLLEA